MGHSIFNIVDKTKKKLRLSPHFDQATQIIQFVSASLAFSLCLSHSLVAEATEVTGRLTTGGYIATEQISLPSSLESRNDVETLSTRFYLKASQWSDSKNEFIADLRDKNDFFGNVDKQNLQLSPSNNFQVHQLSVMLPKSNFFTRLGRFGVSEAGAVADGAEVGIQLSQTLQSAVFGGFNPRVPGQRYYVFNNNAQVYGTYLAYQAPPQSWDKSLYFSNAVVLEKVESDIDRNYWFETFNYQWSQRNRILILSYLDFVPNVYLQTGTVQLQNAISEKWTSSASLLSVDVIEYARLQGIRSLLPSSPYHEAGESLRYSFNNHFWTEMRLISGQRLADGLNRTEYRLVTDYSDFGGHKWDTSYQLGYANDFQSVDTFIKLGVAYFSRRWELSIDEEFRNAVYSEGTYHPVTSELNVARTFRNDFFLTVGLQNVIDERVKIMAAFFKITYRFGNASTTPIRDGAPPRGRL
jgi:hypothetical protein